MAHNAGGRPSLRPWTGGGAGPALLTKTLASTCWGRPRNTYDVETQVVRPLNYDLPVAGGREVGSPANCARASVRVFVYVFLCIFAFIYVCILYISILYSITCI